MSENLEEKEATRENQSRLPAYLSTCPEEGDSIELFGCWSGDEADEPMQRRKIPLADLLGEEFFFIGKEHIAVKKEANLEPASRDNSDPLRGSPSLTVEGKC